MPDLQVLSWTHDRNDAGPGGPRGWGDTLARIAARLGGRVRWRPEGSPARGAAILAWHPEPKALAAALLTRRLTYLCWGLAERPANAAARSRRLMLRLIVRNARRVVCNDAVTRDRLSRAFGVTAAALPHSVDTDWFAGGDAPARPEVLVPGSNDRDETLVRELALGGIPVIRVTQEPKVAAWHAANPAPGLTVMTDIPFPELRALYKGCRAVLLPLRETDHAAGQTAALEAIAAGPRGGLLISEGFTSTIVGTYGGVTVMQAGATAGDWAARIAALPETPLPRAPEIDRHAPDAVADAFAALMRDGG